MKCQHPFPVPNAIGNTNLWRFFMPCWGHPKLYENGWEIPCFFACGRRKRSRPYSFPHGRPDGDTGAQNHRNEHFSKPKEGGIQHGGNRMSHAARKEVIDICHARNIPYIGVTRNPNVFEMQECAIKCEECPHYTNNIPK